MAAKTTKTTTAKSGSSLNFILPKGKITLLPVVREKSFMGNNKHDGLFMYTGSFMSWSIFRDQYGNYIDPLNKKERDYFEKELKEDFNVFHKGNFWETYVFKIKKDTYDMNSLKRTFDLQNPYDYLAYKLLLTAPNIANSLAERDDTPEYKWVLIEEGEGIQGNLRKGKKKAFCYNWLTTNETKKDTLRDILYVLNVKTDIDSSLDEIINLMIDVIESPRMENLYEVLNDEDLNVKILFSKALRARAIVVRRNKYYDTKGDMLATSRNAMLEWLSNEVNQVQVVEINNTINKAKI